MAHPANAAYVSGDGKVSFDQWGRKLDSLGNVAWGDRQTVSGAGGRPIERPQPQQQQQPQAQQQGYNPLSGGSANTGVPVRTGSAVAPAPAQAGQRPIPPGVLAPGGIDPKTGQKVPTYYNGGLGQPAQAWRPPPPQSTAYQQQPQANPLAVTTTGQPWRPLPGDMVLPTQRYTYTDPFAVQDPLSGARSYPAYNPFVGAMSGQPYRDPMSGGAAPRPATIPFNAQGFNVEAPPSVNVTGQPPPYWMVP